MPRLRRAARRAADAPRRVATILSGSACCVYPPRIGAATDQAVAAIRAALARHPIQARVTVSGYEGSELLVARLLIEAGAEVPHIGTALPRTEWSEPDRTGLEARGAHVQYRASLEQDLAAMREVRPDLALGTTPLVQVAKEQGVPALYFTNMVSARPLFGPAGAGALAGIVAAQTRQSGRFSRMVSFFEGVGARDAAGYGFAGKPVDPPGFRERQRKLRAMRAKADEAVGSCWPCSCSITTVPAAIGARSTPSPRCAGCAW